MRALSFALFCPLLVAILSPSATSLRAASEGSGWVLRTWQSDDGLPNNNVTDLAQTPDGYLWIATPAQLARFDGVQFEGFWPKHIAPQYDRKITALLATREGGIYLGMSHGPLLYLHSGHVEVMTEAVLDLNAATIIEDGEHGVWIDYRGGAGSATGGILFRVVDRTVLPVPSSAGGGDSRSVVCDRAGRIWLARDGELSVFERGSFRPRLKLPERMARLAPARAGGLWICNGVQLYRYDDSMRLVRAGVLPIERNPAIPTVVFEDHVGSVWIGTGDHGLFRWANGRMGHVPTSHAQILCLKEDRETNLWVGTGGGGLDRLEPQAIALESDSAGLPFAEVRSLCEDVQGALWAVTENGELARREGDRWSALPAMAGGPGQSATCVTSDSSGAVWIGTQRRALLRWRDGHFDQWQRTDGLVSRVIHSLLVSRTGDVWIAGNAPECLQCWHDGALRTIALPTNAKLVRALVEDTSGTIWAGSANGMLLRIDGDRATDVAASLGGGNLSIRCLHATSDGSLWIGYAGWGLGRLKAGRLTRLTSEQGLFDDQISQLMADTRGWLWLGADHGIFKVRQDEFDDVAAGRVGRLHPIHYGSSDGLPSLQANFGVSPGALRSRDGRIWLPMSTALVVADPQQVRQDPAPPVVLLKRIVVDDRTIAFYGGAVPIGNVVDLRQPNPAVNLPPGHRRLEFEFTALNFAAPENVTFQYRLDGLDDGWIENGGSRQVSYSRLPAGRYTFRVQARNRDGIWSTAASTLSFTVAPFFWQTWWFRLGLFAAFTVLVVAIARYIAVRRLREKLHAAEQQAALDRERARIAKDIHDDVGASLTQVTLLSGLVQRDRGEPEKIGEHVRRISSAVRSVTDALDEIVWAVNPRNDTLPHLVSYLGKYTLEFLRMAGIKCVLELPERPPATTVSAEVRHNLFLVTKEALNNIVRHAQATAVTLTIVSSEHALTITLRDDGRGFVIPILDEATGADGLYNMRQRMAAIGGTCRIESRTGAGTVVVLQLPALRG